MKYALFGYTYQHYIASLMLSLMDVERKIDQIALEVDVDHKFDDIALKAGGQEYFLQIKDIEGIRVDDLIITTDSIKINGKPHKLSKGINILFFKNIDLKTNSKILGLKAQKISDIYLISITREQVEKRISTLYGADYYRRQVIQTFFTKKLDERILDIHKQHLPSITIFDTRLIEKNVEVARKILNFESILHIEGKPGVGKSHLVSHLQKQFKENVLYRFWISNQDRQYEDRLKYTSFKLDLIKKIFYDQKERSEEDIFKKLADNKSTLIIDGLDHVENYHNADLESFINFIDKAKTFCKVIVLSRPLKKRLSWRKQVLRNWNGKQTQKILKELYHIEDYFTFEKIYKLTDGYPILVKYIAEQYKKEGVVPEFVSLDTVNHYYEQLFKDEAGKRALALFLCCRGYIMYSEIRMFLGDIAGSIVEEIIEERPYLFEVKLNRISLYHDSLITYLKNTGVDITALIGNLNTIVFNSLISGQTRFQSRVGHFDLPPESIVKIVRWHSSIDNFKTIVKQVIDFEAVNEFYEHLRQLLCKISPEDLDVCDYYDLGLILNVVTRDHLSTLNGFYYTYVNLLLDHGYTTEDVTSSGYLFGMLVFIKSQDGSFLHDVMSNSYFDTSRFYSDLEDQIEVERSFFERHSQPFRKNSIDKALADTRNLSFKENLKEILVNVYQHNVQHVLFRELYRVVEQFLNGDRAEAAACLAKNIKSTQWRDYQFSWVLNDVQVKLLALGIKPDINEYLNLTLSQYLEKHKNEGSFTLWRELLDYLRLALYQKKTIDIISVSAFWTKYHQRKDYSLLSLNYSLTFFEERGLIDWRDSIVLLTQIQQVSEKGYRGLLASYLMQHKPAFVLQVLSEFEPEELRIPWFVLKADYIDVLPDYIYNQEIGEQFHYHRTNQQIDINDIENLLYSNKIKRLKKDLLSAGFTVRIEEHDKRISELEKVRIPYFVYKDEHKYRDSSDGESQYNLGILNTENEYLIKEKQLEPAEVASFADGNYTALANPEMFQQFEKSVLAEQMQHILFNVLTCKTTSTGSFSSPLMLPGSMLKLISDSGVSADFRRLFESFSDYLKLSMFDINCATSNRSKDTQITLV